MEIVKLEVWKAARDGKTDVLVDFFKKIIRDDAIDEILHHHKDKSGQKTTPLVIAAYTGNDKIVDVLLQFGAKIDQKGTFGIKNRGYICSATALWCASWMGHYNIVKLLVDNGANVNLPTDNGSTPILVACHQGSFEIVRFLVESGADVNATNNYKETCLNSPSEKGYYKIVQYLLENGADPKCVRDRGISALHLSAAWGHFEISKLLIESGMPMT